ncbi:MAG: hypothetical protein IT427_06880 [Pirellulales bacterium]|nr:hypothetical protein [Pirellulales bacterium]
MLAPTPIELIARPANPTTLELLRGRVETGPEIFGSTAAWIAQEMFAIQTASQSLTLVRPQQLRFYSKENNSGFRQLRVRFELQSARYDLPVTDPRWENCPALVRSPFFREHPWPTVANTVSADAVPLITVSLSEPFTDPARCFKLAACIFTAALPAGS